jgi:hypothetical protein
MDSLGDKKSLPQLPRVGFGEGLQNMYLGLRNLPKNWSNFLVDLFLRPYSSIQYLFSGKLT